MIMTSRYSVKPPLGATLNYGHSLAKDIVSAIVLTENGGALAFDSVSNDGLILSGGSKYAMNGILCDGNSKGADILAKSRHKLTGRISMVAGIIQVGTPPNYTSFCGTDYGGGSPYVGYCFDHSGTGRLGCAVNNGSTYQEARDTNLISSYVPYVIAMTFVAGSSLKYYRDGILIASASPGGSNPAYTASTRFHCGVRSTDAANINKVINFWYVFNRELSHQEVIEFYVNPYQIFSVPRFRIFFPASVGAEAGQPMTLRSANVPFTRQWQPQRVGR